jgi:hypothetical protein
MRTVPPKPIERFVGFFIPPACREEVLGDLHERFQNTPRYVVDAIMTVPLVIVSRIRRTTDPVVFLMEAIVLYSSYLAAAFFLDQTLLTDAFGFLRLGLPAAISLLVLMWADAYANPLNRSPLKPMLGPALGVAFAWLSQAVLLAGAADFMLPRAIMIAGSSVSLLLVSALRLLFAPVINIPAHWQKQALVSFRINRPNTAVSIAALVIVMILLIVYQIGTRN